MSKSPKPPAGAIATVASGGTVPAKKPKRIGNQQSGNTGILQMTDKLG